MKHKAQEVLEDISNMLHTTDYVEHIRCQSYPIVEDEQAVIKQLIDCQLTVEEIEWILQQATFYKSVGVTEERIKLCESIIYKTEKQKEMLVSDNDQKTI